MLGLVTWTMLSAITFISFLSDGKEKNTRARLKEKVYEDISRVIDEEVNWFGQNVIVEMN